MLADAIRAYIQADLKGPRFFVELPPEAWPFPFISGPAPMSKSEPMRTVSRSKKGLPVLGNPTFTKKLSEKQIHHE